MPCVKSEAKGSFGPQTCPAWPARGSRSGRRASAGSRARSRRYNAPPASIVATSAGSNGASIGLRGESAGNTTLELVKVSSVSVSRWAAPPHLGHSTCFHARMPIKRIARRLEINVVRQGDRKLVLGHWHDPAASVFLGTMDEGDRRTPVTLARNAPIAQAPHGCALRPSRHFRPW